MRVVRGAEVNLEPASHEPAGAPGVYKRVLARKGELFQGQVQMINWAVFPKGGSFARHYHEDMEEIFVFLDGPVRAEISPVGHGNRAPDNQSVTVTLQRGDCVIISPHERHKMWNESGREIEYVVIGMSGTKNGKTVVVEHAP